MNKIYRNPKLLKLAKEAPVCFACMVPNDGTVVPAHNNEVRFGKGTGIKTSDALVAFVCHDCHYEIDDGRRLTKEQKQDTWTRAYVQTIRWLFESGFVNVVGA